MRLGLGKTIIVAALATAISLWGAHAASASPAVRTVSPAALHQVVASHSGHVLVVNFWATYCPDCVAEFSGLVKLKNTYHGNGLDVVFVSGDDPGDKDARVIPFLTGRGVSWTTYLMDNIATFGPAFDHHLSGAFALPRTYVYNRNGRLVKVFSTASSYAGFRAAVKPLL